MKRSQAFMLVGSLLVTAAIGIAKAEDPRSMLDGDVVAQESSYVELVVDASGDVIQVRVNGCEPCEKGSYLPYQRLAISSGGKLVDRKNLDLLNGKPGTLVINSDTGLVIKVDFWPDYAEEGDNQ